MGETFPRRETYSIVARHVSHHLPHWDSLRVAVVPPLPHKYYHDPGARKKQAQAALPIETRGLSRTVLVKTQGREGWSRRVVSFVESPVVDQSPGCAWPSSAGFRSWVLIDVDTT